MSKIYHPTREEKEAATAKRKAEYLARTAQPTGETITVDVFRGRSFGPGVWPPEIRETITRPVFRDQDGDRFICSLGEPWEGNIRWYICDADVYDPKHPTIPEMRKGYLYSYTMTGRMHKPTSVAHVAGLPWD